MGVRPREGQLTERGRDRLALVAALLCALPFAAATLSLPFGRDQGIYAWSGDRLLAGVPLYAGVFTFKPPMTPIVHAASQLMFGHSMFAIRAFDVVWTLATVAMMSAFARRSSGSRTWGVLAAMWWGYIYHSLDFWTVSQTDGWANLPLAVAFVLVTTWRDDETDRWRLVDHATAGVMLGVAFMFKYTLAIYAPFLLIVPLLRHGRAGIKDVVAIIAGGLASLAGFGVWLAWAGSLGAFIDTQLHVTLPYTSDLPRSRDGVLVRLGIYFGKIDNLGWFALVTSSIGLIAAIGVAWRRRDRTDRRTVAALALSAWAFGGLFSAWIQGKYFPYHFLPLIAPIALLGSALPTHLLEVAAARTHRRWLPIAGAVAVFAGLAIAPPFPDRWRVVARIATRDTTLDAQARKYRTRDMSMTTCLDVAAWIRAHSLPTDPIFVWGYDPVIYFLSERPQVSRFPYTYPMVVAWSPPEMRLELMDALNANPPIVIGIASHDATPTVMGHNKDSWQTFQEFPALKDFVDQRYGEPSPVGTYRMFLRSDRAVRGTR